MLLAVGRQSLPVADGHRAMQACPLYGCSCWWKSSSEPSPDVYPRQIPQGQGLLPSLYLSV